MRASPAPQPQPLGVALGVGEPAVQHGHVVAEAGPEAARELRGERDLRHQHQRAPPSLSGPRDDPQVDLGLARAGHAVEQERLESAERTPERLHRPGLGRGEGRGCRAGGEHPAARHRGLGVEPHQAAALQGLERGPPVREGRLELVHRDAAAGHEVVQDGPLGAGPRERGQGRGGVRRRRRELHPPARRPGVALAPVEARRQRSPQELARRHQVVVLRPADELDQASGEGGERIRAPRARPGARSPGAGRWESPPRTPSPAGSCRTAPPPAVPGQPPRPWRRGRGR